MIDLARYPALAAGGTWHWSVDIDWRFLPYSAAEDRDVSGVRVVAFSSLGVVLPLFEWTDGRREAAPPGGGLEDGEHWVNAAIREVREEAGARVITLHPFGILEIHSHGSTHYRAHLPHPVSRRIVAWADVLVDGEPAPEDYERVLEVLQLAPEVAVARLVQEGDGLHAELVRLACEMRSSITDGELFYDTRRRVR